MKFRSFLYCFLLIFQFISYTSINKRTNEVQKIGAWGPVNIKAKGGTDAYFLINKKNPGNQIDLLNNKNNGTLNLYPTFPLTIGDTYQLLDSHNETVLDNLQIQKPCLIYLNDPNGQPEIWKKCADNIPIQITKTGGKVQDYTASWSGDKIFFTAAHNSNSLDIWQIKSDGSEPNKIFECSDSKCSDLAYSPLTDTLAFVRTGDKQQIELLNLIDKSISNIQNSASDLNFSPNGQYLSFLNISSNELTIINLANMTRVTQPSGAGLVGEWSRDSHSILFGQLNYWGGIPDISIYKLEIDSGILTLLFSSQNQELEFWQPAFTGDQGIYLVAVRQSNSGSGKQLWLLNREGSVVKQITSDPLYHYSNPRWNSDYSELVFQRYPITTSTGLPQIITWNKAKDTFLISGTNATNPIWLP
jgi:hypothetical protein